MTRWRRTAAKTRAKVPLPPENRVALKQRSAARQRGFGSRQNANGGRSDGTRLQRRVTRPETSNETKARSSEMRNPPEAAPSVQPWNPRVLSEATRTVESSPATRSSRTVKWGD